MRVLVVSPHTQGNGNTTVALMMGIGFAKQGKEACICHLSKSSDSLVSYLGVDTTREDKTVTSSQVVKLAKSGGLKGTSVKDYCKKVCNNFEAFLTDDSYLDDEVWYMTEYAAKNFPQAHLIIDGDTNDIKELHKVAELVDIVVINVTQDIVELKKFREKLGLITKAFNKNNIIVCVNRYHSARCKVKDMASIMGLKKPGNWVFLHENPYISWAENYAKLDALYNTILDGKDSRIVDTASECNKIATTIQKVKLKTKKVAE